MDVLHLFNQNILTGCEYLSKLAAKVTQIRTVASLGWMGTFYCLTAIALAHGQTTPSSQSSSTSSITQNASTIQAYAQEQRALMQQRRALVAQGATQQQLQAWSKQNASQFAAQEQRAEALTVTLSLQRPASGTQSLHAPANASQDLKDFLVTRATLAKAFKQLHGQMLQQATTSKSGLSFTELDQMEEAEHQTFQNQNAQLLALQSQRTQSMSQAPIPVRGVPSSVVIRAGTTSQMAAFLTTRNQLRRQMIQLENQYATATPAVRDAAIQKWRQDNASLFTQFRQDAQNLPRGTGQ